MTLRRVITLSITILFILLAGGLLSIRDHAIVHRAERRHRDLAATELTAGDAFL